MISLSHKTIMGYSLTLRYKRLKPFNLFSPPSAPFWYRSSVHFGSSLGFSVLLELFLCLAVFPFTLTDVSGTRAAGPVLLREISVVSVSLLGVELVILSRISFKLNWLITGFEPLGSQLATTFGLRSTGKLFLMALELEGCSVVFLATVLSFVEFTKLFITCLVFLQ